MMSHRVRRRWMARAASLVCSFVLVASGVPAHASASGTQGAEPWTHRAKLVAPDGAINDFLGRAVSIDGNTAVVGAAGADVGGSSSQGAVYVFVRSGDTWAEQTKLTAEDGAAGDEFGFAVAISADTIAVGARFATVDGINGKGAVYMFVRSGTEWIAQAKLAAKDGAAFDQLGFSVARTAIRFSPERRSRMAARARFLSLPAPAAHGASKPRSAPTTEPPRIVSACP